MILVGDIGGTNTRLALAEFVEGRMRLSEVKRYSTPEDLPSLVRKYLLETGAAGSALRAVALCGAGPVRPDGSIQLTNHPCVLEPAALAEAAGGVRVHVVNDFAAVALAIPALGRDDLRRCGGPAEGSPTGARLVIGAGTGLGIAGLLPNGKDWIVAAGEGGHVDLAPVDDDELQVWQFLRADSTRLSAESVASGPGLQRLYAAAGGKQALDGAAIVAAARSGDSQARDAQRLFTRWFGRVAGNAALTYGATGGVYIAGGIVPAWGESFDAAIFRAGFEHKPPLDGWLRQVPSAVVTHAEPALLGLARLGSEG